MDEAHSLIDVSIQRLAHGAGIDLPQHQSAHAAGMDIHAAVDADVTIDPGRIALVPSGFAIAVPAGYEAQVRPRSGLATKHGLTIPNAPGTIDADYRGEVKVALMNLGSEPITITRNMRIAQIIFAPVAQARWRPVMDLPPTDRGDGGFGHTGT
ncbi:MAG: dUTP diphosphatase [Alphaproteobacteria bacterium]|nr:dUTP diphosphatase [Alphaproteobacteria bacterium]